MKGGLWTKFALALGGSRIVSKKWTDQCEDCSLKKKTRRERLKSALYLRLKKRSFKPVEGGPFELFENPVCCKISNKLKGGSFEDKKISIFFDFRNKTKNENFEQSHSAKIHKRGDPLGFLAL